MLLDKVGTLKGCFCAEGKSDILVRKWNARIEYFFLLLQRLFYFINRLYTLFYF